MYAVSDFVFSRWIDADALDLESSVFVPRLPQRPGLHGKPIQPSYFPFRSPGRPDCNNASKVSRSTVLHWADIYRFDLDAATLMAGPRDSVLMLWVISVWLCIVGTSQVSHFNILLLFVIKMLDLDLYRSEFDSIASTAGSNDPIGTLGWEFRWLHDVHASQVSHFNFCRLTDISRYDFQSSALMPESNDSIGMFGVDYRWLHCTGASMVSRFEFLHLADLYRFEFDSTASMAMPNVSVRMLCKSDEWPR